MNNTVSFYLNGKAVSIENPSPDLLLIDYLRSPGVALAGPKKPCGEGGCGGCTVILSRWDDVQGVPEHRAINSCLRPVCALNGLVVTTVEGTGAVRKPDPQYLRHTLASSRNAPPIGEHFSPVLSQAKEAAEEKRLSVLAAVQERQAEQINATTLRLVENVAEHPSEHSHEGMNPVAHRLAANNGSQCGYCSVGFVMNMSEFITNHPNATKKEIEEAFDGNLCRCTGYRAILTGMKTFASDWDAEDEEERMICLEDELWKSQLPASVAIPFPAGARLPAGPLASDGDRQSWLTPTSLAELAEIVAANQDKKIRLVHGNTSYGVYKTEYPGTGLFIDIRSIPELSGSGRVHGNELIVPAGTSYSDLLDLLAVQMETNRTTTLTALDFMARRTAGRIVRNAASLGGNTMLVLKHIPKCTGAPFPSDLFTTLYAVDARITFLVLGDGTDWETATLTAAELTAAVVEEPALAERIVILAYGLPLGKPNEVVFAQKVALREVNAHSIVNATTRFALAPNGTVDSAALVFGGIAPYPWRASHTEAAMANQELSLAQAGQLSKILAEEVRDQLKDARDRMAEVPEEGFSEEYRIQLAVAFFYKAIVNALLQREREVPSNIRSSGEVKWGKWPVSKGRQQYERQDFKAPVAQPYIKNTAMYQTSGQLHYTQELPVPPLTANAAFVQSQRALASYHFIFPNGERGVTTSALREHLSRYAPDSFIDLITHENIKNGGINLQGMGMDQPIFAVDMVSYVGQSIALVLASSEQEAIRIADYVATQCVAYSQPGKAWSGKWSEPIIDLLDAIEKGSIYPDAPAAVPFVSHIWRITRPGSQLDWVEEKKPLDREISAREAIVGTAPCLVVESSQLNGGQVHFYMETQACIATPSDEGRIVVQPSSQSPMAMHQTTAMALGLHYHQVEIDIAPVGGGFGGKTEQTRFVTGAAAVAAKATKRPVRLAVPRAEDTAMIGKRHAYYGQYQIAVDTGSVREEDRGIIHGFQVKLWGDGGAFYDCSFIVSNCIQLRTDNAYRIANFQSQIDVCRTNTAPSTAMRAFGDVQGKNIIENALDDAAVALGMSPEMLREKNLYERGDVTPFGQALSYCYMRQVWEYVKQVSQYEEKRAEVEAFNAANKWTKRGISITPVKYGSGYNLLQLEQAAAMVVVNHADGTIVVHQGGVEIGQGLATQAQQVAAYVLGVPMEMIFIDNANTSIIPNPTSTGGSTGTPYTAEAIKQTCEQLRARMMEFGYQLLKDNGDEWCKNQGVDFWNYGFSGSSVVTESDLIDLPSLAKNLTEAKEQTIFGWLADQLSAKTVAALQEYRDAKSKEEQLRKQQRLQILLAADLTSLIRQGEVLDERYFDRKAVSRAAAELGLRQIPTEGDALVRLNRQLLGNALPAELSIPRGWATMVKPPNKDKGMIWQFLVQIAYAKRVNLVTSFTAKIGGGEVPVPAMTFKTEDQQPDIPGIERIKNAKLGGGVDSFVGFTYSAACSVAEVDVLTGEVKIISSDIVYDMGRSMNPALDIGQVEGAFIQGVGYLLTEKLVFEPDGEHKGRLNTDNTWRYKIPAVTTIPLEMNTYLFPRGDKSVVDIPEDTNDIFSAKEVGEPPLVLANSVFFAVKAAIRASRVERGLEPLFRFDAPATVQEVRLACAVSEDHLSGD